METTGLVHKPKQCDLVLQALRTRRWVPFEEIVSGYTTGGMPYRITQQNARKNELQRAGFEIITRMRRRDPALDGAGYAASDWRLADADGTAVSHIATQLAIIKGSMVADHKHLVAVTLPYPIRDRATRVPDVVHIDVCRLTPRMARDQVEIHGGHRMAAVYIWRSYIDGTYLGNGVTTVRGCEAGVASSVEQCDQCTAVRCVNRLGVL